MRIQIPESVVGVCVYMYWVPHDHQITVMVRMIVTPLCNIV